jgi:hypothetical protein
LQANYHNFTFGRDRRGRLERQDRRQGQSGKSAPPAPPEERALLWLVNHAAVTLVHPLPGLLASSGTGG